MNESLQGDSKVACPKNISLQCGKRLWIIYKAHFLLYKYCFVEDTIIKGFAHIVSYDYSFQFVLLFKCSIFLNVNIGLMMFLKGWRNYLAFQDEL